LPSQKQLLVDSVKLDLLLKSYWNEGFLFAGIDSLVGDVFYLHRGKQIPVSAESKGSESWKKVNAEARETVKDMTNNGYPFAKYSWDSLSLEKERLRFKIKLDSGPYVLFDSVVLLNEIKTSREFLAKTLGIGKGSPYNESSYQTIPQKINRISFLTLRQPQDISFQDGKAWTYLDLSEGSTGSFQGILGVLPNQSAGQGVLVTGNLDLQLLNLFRSGKELNFGWAQFAEQSQRLEAAYRHPFIAGTALHLNTSFKLFKQDTSFLNRESSISGSFYVAPQVEMGFGYQRQNATVLTTQLSVISDRNWLDFDQDWYLWSIRKGLDRIVKAKNQTVFSTDFAIGRRQVKRNFRLPIAFYDTIELQKTNFKWEGQAQIQRQLSKQSFLYGSFSFAHLNNSPSVNQFYRIGGLQTFRGFNEQFFYTPTYVVTQLEGRLFFEEQSYVFVFYDQGFLKIKEWSTPLGLGAGFSLLTNSGLFSFAMALGRSSDIPMELANMKIHFGYLSKF
jgi:hypothetical protein